MTDTLAVAALAACVALLLGVAPAAADRFGVIGDSLSTAMSADDNCADVADCLLQIREDRAYSFAGGEQPWSLYRRLADAHGLDGVVDRSRNGARWVDAPGQARDVVRAGDVRVVNVQLGGNDVCRDVGEPLPALDEIEAQVDDALRTLTGGLAAGAEVLLNEVPEVVQLYGLLRARPHFLFQSCQALWDLDAARLGDDAVRALCGAVGQRCDSGFGLALARPLVAALFEDTFEGRFGAEFPCGRVLDGRASDAQRADARAFNRALNALLQQRAAAFDGAGGVAVRYVGGVFARRFETGQVSALDCFHPSRDGQRLLADTLWQHIRAAGVDPLFSDGFEP